MKVLWKNKEKPWNWLAIGKHEYARLLFLHIMKAPHNTCMWHPRMFIWFNLYFMSYWRDNCNIRIGVGLGKTQYCLHYHH